MVLTALRNGQGVAAAARVFIENDLAAGHLVALHEESDDMAAGYDLVWRAGIQRPALKHFLRWIRGGCLIQARTEWRIVDRRRAFRPPCAIGFPSRLGRIRERSSRRNGSNCSSPWGWFSASLLRRRMPKAHRNSATRSVTGYSIAKPYR